MYYTMQNRAETHCSFGFIAFCCCLIILCIISLSAFISVLWYVFSPAVIKSGALDCVYRNPYMYECSPFMDLSYSLCHDSIFEFEAFWSYGQNCTCVVRLASTHVRVLLVTTGFRLDMQRFNLLVEPSNNGVYLRFSPSSIMTTSPNS